MNFEDLTQFEKEYINSLLEWRLKEYDEYFKKLCERYSPQNPIWQSNVDKLRVKCDFILNIREKLGFYKLSDQLSLDEICDIVREFEDEQKGWSKNESKRTN